MGRRVTAVDFDERMLEHVRGAETVLSRIEDLDLGRTFGGVVMMSNLINTTDDAQRARLLATCRRHVDRDGVVLIERYDPEAGLDTTPTERSHAGIVIRTSDIRREGDRLFQTMEFDAGERGRWTYRMEGARILSEDDLASMLAQVGLRLNGWLDPRRRWALVTPA